MKDYDGDLEVGEVLLEAQVAVTCEQHVELVLSQCEQFAVLQ